MIIIIINKIINLNITIIIVKPQINKNHHLIVTVDIVIMQTIINIKTIIQNNND